MINAISKHPKESTFGELGVEIGSHESYEASADFGSALTKDGSVLYRLTAIYRDNEEDSNGFPVEASRYYIAPAITWKISPRPTTLLSDSYQKSTQYGLYAQEQIKLDSKWVGTFSIRQDWTESELEELTDGGGRDQQDDHAFTGRAGFTYLAANGLAPYASYSTSFYPNSGVDSAGQAFDPTEGRQYEIGLKYAPENIPGGATLSIFDLTQTNSLTTDPANTAFYKASGEWRTRGIEFEGNLAVTDHIDLLVNASYDRVKITGSEDGDEGNTPALTPEKVASAWLNYTFHEGALDGLTLGGGIRYVGTSYSSNYNTSKNNALTVLDLAARYVRGPWVYALNVNNVFDEVEWIDTDYQYNKTAGNSANFSVAYHW